MIDLELAKKIGATHFGGSNGQLYKFSDSECGLLLNWLFHDKKWVESLNTSSSLKSLERIDFNQKSPTKTLQSVNDDSTCRQIGQMRELSKMLSCCEAIVISEVLKLQREHKEYAEKIVELMSRSPTPDLDELCEKYFWIIDGCKGEDEYRLSVKRELSAFGRELILKHQPTATVKEFESYRFDSEELECAMMYLDDIGAPRGDGDNKYSIVGRIRSIEAPVSRKSRTKVEYVKCEFEKLSDLVLFVESENKLYTKGCDFCEVGGMHDAIRRYELSQQLHRRTEVEIDWKKEVAIFIGDNAIQAPAINDGFDFEVDGEPLTKESFLEMCRVALRATGELTDKPNS